jgi:hypothetical protein
MVQEMLFDYATHSLEASRSAEVKSEIEKSELFQDELIKIQTGLKYFDHMFEVKISSSLADEIQGRKSYLQLIRISLSLSQWPPIVKWALEAFVIILIVVLLTVLVPWNQIREFALQESKTELILAEVMKKTEVLVPKESVGIVADNSKFDDEVVRVPETPKPANTEIKLAKAAATVVKVEEPKKQGFVYRGTAKIVNAEVGSLKLKDKIIQLGGRKAGEVELGWKRNQGDYYFHFTIPESKLAELETYIKSVGDIQLSRDPHPRIMPNGIVRFIFTTEESQN